MIIISVGITVVSNIMKNKIKLSAKKDSKVVVCNIKIVKMYAR